MIWEQDSFFQVKVKGEEEASPRFTAHPEASSLHFGLFHYEKASSLHQVLTQLQELCCQWLRSESSSKEQMLELLVLEQFLDELPLEIQA